MKLSALISPLLLAALPAHSIAGDFYRDLAALPGFSADTPAAAAPLKLSALTGDVKTFSMPAFLAGRRVWVYLPPGYASQPGRRYPVLYLHDGQNLFDASTSFSGEWGVDEACEELIRAGRIPPLIVVGVDNGQAARLDEYTPWADPEYGGGKAHAYLAALKTILKPEIDRRYRTFRDPANTFIGGSSLGGLVSAYAGCADPGTWGGVIAMSPSYWWAGEKFAAWMKGQKKPALKFLYQDMGTREGDSPEKQLGALRRVEQAALSAGFTEGKDFFSLEAQGHTHSEGSWRERFPQVLELLLRK